MSWLTKILDKIIPSRAYKKGYRDGEQDYINWQKHILNPSNVTQETIELEKASVCFSFSRNTPDDIRKQQLAYLMSKHLCKIIKPEMRIETVRVQELEVIEEAAIIYLFKKPE